MAEIPTTTTAPANTTSLDATPAATPALDKRSEDERHLHSIFPDLDETTIHDCYVLCERNVERTVEFLLGTDNNDAPSNTNTAPAGMSQSEIDEQLARQFEQEELAAAAAAWNPRPVAAAPAPDNASSFHRDGHTQGSQAAPESNEPNFQEQFNKFAETGKKTLTSIFNKVRDKIKEFDAPPAGGPSNPQMQQQQHYQYYAPEAASPVAPNTQVQSTSPTPYQSTYAPPAAPPPGATQVTQSSTSGSSALSGVAAPVTVNPPATSTSSSAAVPPNIDLSKTAFLPRKPAPLPENKPEDLTESPFEDRDR